MLRKAAYFQIVGVNLLRCQVIVNPAAGRGEVNKLIPRIKELLYRRGIYYELTSTKSPGEAVELARQAAKTFNTVVAVGGDGTVNEVINGLMGTDAVLGVIPAGTGNDLARTLNIPFDLDKAVSVLEAGRPEAIDIGKDIDGYFCDILGIGFPSDVMHNANTSTNIFRGSTAIKASIIQTINKLQPYTVHIETDDDSFSPTVMGVFILNNRYTGGGVQIAPDAKYNDGLLDVVIMHEMGKLEILGVLPKAYSGKHVGHPSIQILRTKKIRITAPTPMRKDFDGNIYGTTPVDTEVLPRALNVLVPGL